MPLLCQQVCIDGSDGSIGITMKNNQGYRFNDGPVITFSTLSHRAESGMQVMRCTVRKTRMYSYCGVKVWIGCGHNGGHSSARRQSGDVDLSIINIVMAHDLLCNPCNQRWFPSISLLIRSLEPAPAS